MKPCTCPVLHKRITSCLQPLIMHAIQWDSIFFPTTFHFQEDILLSTFHACGSWVPTIIFLWYILIAVLGILCISFGCVPMHFMIIPMRRACVPNCIISFVPQ